MGQNQTTQTLLISIITFLVGGIVGYAFAQPSWHGWGMGSNDYRSGWYGNGMMNGAMQGMTVSSEREFLELMIPHHEEAVSTAREVLERGATTPGVRKLMESIITAQEAEIADMKEWYMAWYEAPYENNDTYVPMMRDLSGLTGTALDQAFLSDMIMHHMGAIMMARSLVPYIEHEELMQLAENIVRTQSAEIRTMRTLLQAL